MRQRLDRAGNIYDVVAILLVRNDRWFTFCALRGELTPAQAQRLVSAFITFSDMGSYPFFRLLNAPWESSGFSRGMFGRLPDATRQLPKDLRDAIEAFPDELIRPVALATWLVSNFAISVTIVDSFSMDASDAKSILGADLPNTAIRNPEILATLSAKAREVLTVGDQLPPKSYEGLEELAEGKNLIVIDLSGAAFRNAFQILVALNRAVHAVSALPVIEAIRLLERERRFGETKDRAPLPETHFSEYDETVCLTAVLDHARGARILQDRSGFALFDVEALPDKRFFIGFPGTPDMFVSDMREEYQAAYDTAPLAFAIRHRRQWSRSHFLSSNLEKQKLLKAYANEVALREAVLRMNGIVRKVGEQGISSAGHAAFSASLYFMVAKVLGMHDAVTVAALEGVVQLCRAAVRRGGK